MQKNKDLNIEFKYSNIIRYNKREFGAIVRSVHRTEEQILLKKLKIAKFPKTVRAYYLSKAFQQNNDPNKSIQLCAQSWSKLSPEEKERVTHEYLLQKDEYDKKKLRLLNEMDQFQ